MSFRSASLLLMLIVVVAWDGCSGKSSSPPTIVAQPESTAVIVGTAAQFTVVVAGTPPFNYQWSKTEGGVTKPIVGANDATLTTLPAALSDAGVWFSVSVSNALGHVSSAQAALAVLQPAAWDVLTFHNDLGRTGQNLSETLLTPANVNQTHFGKVAFHPTDGKVDAQPLVVSNQPVGASGRNVVYVATEHDTVYAFDADTGVRIWQTSLLPTGETPSDAHSCFAVVPEIGVSSTPVIDRTRGVIYVVASTRNGNTYLQRLHALNLGTGAEALGGPSIITATYSGHGGQILEFDPAQYKERAALLLANGKVYTSWSSHCDNIPYSSWVIALDASTLQVTQVFNGEPTGTSGQASFWNSGSGPAADAGGNVYLMSANGAFDPTLDADGFPVAQNYGNAFVKLAPPASGSGVLKLIDYFTMFNTVSESASDLDLGSGGSVVLPDQTDSSGTVRHLIVGGGKDTNVYLLERDNMGKFNAVDNSQIWQELASAFPYGSDGIFGSPAYFYGNLYFGASNDVLRAFTFAGAKLSTTPSMQSANVFPDPGVTPSISANGTVNGIVWVIENSSTQGVLHAYDANNLSSELYNSNLAGARDSFGPGSKWNPPTIANGKVYVCTQVDLTNNPTGAKQGVAVFGAL